MLEAMRQGAGKWFVKIFLGVLAASFALWGVGDIVTSRPDSAVITVGDASISGSEYVAAYSRNLNLLQRQYGGQITEEMARGELEQETTRSLTQRLIYQEATKDLDLTVTEAELTSSIAKNQVFHDVSGQFSASRFRDVLMNANLSEGSYLAQVRSDLANQQLFNSLTGSVTAPTAMVDSFFKYSGEKRRIEVLTIPFDTITDVAPVEEVEITKYYQDNEDAFFAPEYRRLVYVALRPEDLMDGIEVDEKDLKQEFDFRQGDFARAETREIEQILVGDDKAAAEQVASRLAGGEDFYAVAKEITGFGPEDVKLGEMVKADLPEEAREAVFALPLNQASTAIEGPFGWAIYRATRITAGETPDFAKARPILEKELKLRLAADNMVELANSLDDELAAGSRLEEAAEKAGLKVEVIEATDERGRGRDGQPVANAPKVSGVIGYAFGLEEGQEPLLQTSQNGNYFLVRVDGITAPALRPLEEVKDDIASILKAEKQRKAALAKAKALGEQLAAASSLADQKAAGSWSYKTLEPMNRSEMSREESVSLDLLNALFKGEKSHVATGSNRIETGASIARVLEIIPADATNDKALRDSLSDNVAKAIAADLQSQYQAALERAFKVEVDQDLIKALLDQRG